MPQILDLSVRDFVTATAAKQPTPGGGSVAALVGALAASLAHMALAYTTGKKNFAQHEPAIQAAMAQLTTASTLLQNLIAEDIAAYAALSDMLKLPKDQRSAHPDYVPAVVAAIRCPQTAGAIALNILSLCETLLDKTSKMIISDLGIAAVYAHATVHASELNVRINLPLLPNQAEAADIKSRLTDTSAKADAIYARIRAHMLSVM